jgi:tripartite motif-containing protein 2/3/tripartite motif-containing protein 71
MALQKMGDQLNCCSSAVDTYTNPSAIVQQLFCEACSEVICYKCAVDGSKQHSHGYESLLEKYKDEISAYFEPMGKKLTGVDHAVNIRCADSSSLQESVSELLDAHKTKLLCRIQEIAEDVQESFDTQSVQESCTSEGQCKMLKTRKRIICQVQELATKFLLKPSMKPLAISDNVASSHCEIEPAMSMLNPTECHLTGKALESTIVWEESVVTVQAVRWNGCPYLEPIMSLECELESVLTGARVRGRVEELGQGLHEMSYHPITKGMSLLHIRAKGQNIKGSPFDVKVMASPDPPRIPIQTLSTSANPFGVAFNLAGEVVVCTQDGVAVYSLNGTHVRSFGTYGSGPGQFVSPSGVAVDNLDNILVVDEDSNRIQKFTSEGQFLASVGTEGVEPLQFDRPMDIAFDTLSKKVFVVDSESHRVQVLNSDLTLCNIIGGQRGSNDGQLTFPLGVACDSTGNVYIADSGNNRIQVFTASGKFLRKFGSYGKNEGQLDWPIGVAVDARDMVFVGEDGNHRISVFSPTGRFITSFGQRGERLGEFSSPRWLAMDDCGVLFVCDVGNYRLQMF